MAFETDGLRDAISGPASPDGSVRLMAKVIGAGMYKWERSSRLCLGQSGGRKCEPGLVEMSKSIVPESEGDRLGNGYRRSPRLSMAGGSILPRRLPEAIKPPCRV